MFHFRHRVERHWVKKNGRSTKRNFKTGRSWPGKSDELVAAEEFLIMRFRKSMQHQPIQRPIDRPMWCVFWFFYPEKWYYVQKTNVKRGAIKGAMSKNVADQSNLYEFPQDCMQTAGVILDDQLIQSHDLSRRIPCDEFALEIFLFDYPIDKLFPKKWVDPIRGTAPHTPRSN